MYYLFVQPTTISLAYPWTTDSVMSYIIPVDMIMCVLLNIITIFQSSLNEDRHMFISLNIYTKLSHVLAVPWAEAPAGMISTQFGSYILVLYMLQVSHTSNSQQTINPWTPGNAWVRSQLCGYWWPGALAQRWLNIHCIGPVSCNDIVQKVNSIRKWNHIFF